MIESLTFGVGFGRISRCPRREPAQRERVKAEPARPLLLSALPASWARWIAARSAATATASARSPRVNAAREVLRQLSVGGSAPRHTTPPRPRRRPSRTEAFRKRQERSRPPDRQYTTKRAARQSLAGTSGRCARRLRHLGQSPGWSPPPRSRSPTT